MNMIKSSTTRFQNLRPLGLLVFLSLTVLAGCAGEMVHREGMRLLEQGQIEAGFSALEKAVREAPGNASFRKDLYVRKAAYIDQLLMLGESRRMTGDVAGAEESFNKVLVQEPNNVRARTGLDNLARDRRHDEVVGRAKKILKNGDIDSVQRLLSPVLAENPEFPAAVALRRELAEIQARRQQSEQVLRGTHAKPVNVEFRDADVRMVFEALSRSSGINFILDKDVRPDLRTSIFLKGAAVEDAVDLILQSSQLQKKILNGNTALIYPNTSEKLKEYQELVVKSFYLKNADAKQVQNTLKTLLKAKDLVIDEKLNLVIMRDTPEAVRLAEKLVAAHDMAEPEVMLEIEVLEVQRSRVVELGLQWPMQLSLAPLASGGSSLTLDELRNLNGSRIGATISKATLNLRQELADTNLLANPRIRVRNREKAKVMVGDKIPIVTTTATATGFVADSIQYMDVGLKVEFEPDIHLQSDVAIKVGLEVSSLGAQVTTANGTVAYQIGTRNATTTLRLKDGETQILAGLINDEERASGTGLPGLASLPLIGRLFSSRQDSHKKTEIVLSITPHLIRNLQRPDADQSEFWSGSENTLRTRPLSLQPVRTTEPPPVGASATTGSTGSEGSALISNVPGEPPPPAQNVAVSWGGPTQVKPGEQFRVQLKVKADGVLRSLPFQAAYDPAVLQIVEITEGEFFKQDDGASSFSSNIDGAAGKFFVSVSRTAAAGVQGEGVAAVVTFRALAVSPKTDVALTTVAPIVDGGKTPATPLPAPLSVAISQ